MYIKMDFTNDQSLDQEAMKPLILSSETGMPMHRLKMLSSQDGQLVIKVRLFARRTTPLALSLAARTALGFEEGDCNYD